MEKKTKRKYVWITVDEFAMKNNISRARVYQLVSGYRDKPPTFKLGKDYRYCKGKLRLNNDSRPKPTGRPRKESN